MAQVRISVRGSHFGALHEQRAVGLLRDVIGVEWTSKARPTGARVELIERAEERLSRHDVHVDSCLMIIPEVVLERPFRRLVLRYFVLQWRQRATQLGVSRLGLHGIHRWSHLGMR